MMDILNREIRWMIIYPDDEEESQRFRGRKLVMFSAEMMCIKSSYRLSTVRDFRLSSEEETIFEKERQKNEQRQEETP